LQTRLPGELQLVVQLDDAPCTQVKPSSAPPTPSSSQPLQTSVAEHVE